jgi:hypothetical protein
LAPFSLAAFSLRRLEYNSGIMAERPTSVAKGIEGLHQEESALDRARALRDQFAHAQEQNNQKQAERPRETEKAGSQMVKDDRPVLRPTPNGPMRQMPDRQAAVAKLAQEHDNADAKIEAARKARETFKARQGKSHDHDHDRDQ